MERRFEGTFQTENEAREEIKRLINEEHYTADELLIITDDQNRSKFNSETLGSVEVDIVDSDDNGSFWEKIKETLSFGTYNSQETQSAIEEHGVPHDVAEQHMDALTEGDIVLLADTDAPKSGKLSDLNKEMTTKKEQDFDMNKENNARPIDSVNTEEEKAIKNDEANPSDVETTETDNQSMNQSIDPSQAQDTRKEEQVDTNEKDRSNQNVQNDYTTTEDDGRSLETNPDLTGEEDTVVIEDTDRGYPDNIAHGVVKPEATNPLNTEPKSEKSPSENTQAPESDAKYTTASNEAGMKEEPSKEDDKK